jgi:uncharacterized cupin superfamily protein
MNRTRTPSILILAVLTLSPLGVGAEDTLRVAITGINEAGQSVFVSDGEPGLMLSTGPGAFMGDLWKIDTMPMTNQDGYEPRAYALEPKGAGGVSFRVASIPPQEQKLESTGKESGMHQTDTIDFITIISGELYSRLDSGQEVLLKAGDTLVQRGTNHAWINRGDVPCVFSAVMIKPAIATLSSQGAH